MTFDLYETEASILWGAKTRTELTALMESLRERYPDDPDVTGLLEQAGNIWTELPE